MKRLTGLVAIMAACAETAAAPAKASAIRIFEELIISPTFIVSVCIFVMFSASPAALRDR